MTIAHDTNLISTAANVVDDAVGMEKKYWFVAIVNHNTEKIVAKKLKKLEIEYYLPTQSEYKIWKNGRKVRVDRVVIPSTIFIYCTEQKRREIVKYPFINRFLIDRAQKREDNNTRALARISDKEIATLKFMLGNSDTPITFVNKIFNLKDTVRVIRGNLLGIIGKVERVSEGQSKLIVCIGMLGGAMVEINTNDLEIYKN